LRCPSHCFAEGELFAAPTLPRALILVDGNPLRPFPWAHTNVIQGDGTLVGHRHGLHRCQVTRDRLMCELGGEDGRYGFAEHKGYATERHCTAIRDYGPCRHHRPLFLRKILAGEPIVGEQVDLELVDFDA
jgi:ribonuclease HII